MIFPSTAASAEEEDEDVEKDADEGTGGGGRRGGEDPLVSRLASTTMMRSTTGNDSGWNN